MNLFSDKVAIVTGGGSGIGRALCEALVARGAIAVVADVDFKSATAVAGTLGQGARAAALDVADFSAVKAVVEATCARHGRLNYMFNNAGVGIVGEVRDCTPDHWRKMIDVNLMGVIHGSLAAYPEMIARGGGHIVNTSSITGLIPSPILAPYSTTKWAITGFSMALRAEAAALGVRVSLACPSLVCTNMGDRTVCLRVRKEDYLARLPRRWMMTPQRTANAILRGVAANRAMIVCPWHGRLLWWLYRACPALLGPLSRLSVKEWRRMRVT